MHRCPRNQASVTKESTDIDRFIRNDSGINPNRAPWTNTIKVVVRIPAFLSRCIHHILIIRSDINESISIFVKEGSIDTELARTSIDDVALNQWQIVDFMCSFDSATSATLMLKLKFPSPLSYC